MGSIDQIYFVIMFIVTVIVTMAVFSMWNDSIKDDALFDKTTVGMNIRTKVSTTFNSMDNVLIMVYVFIHLGIIILAFMQRIHPVFAVISIILSLVMVVLIAPLVNSYGDIIEDDMFSNNLASFPKTDYLMHNLIKFEIAWFFITTLVTYGVSRYDLPYG